MHFAEISRTDFVAAIEAGIEAAGETLTRAERIALRSVGATAQTAARGSMGDSACGCPLAQVGLVPTEDATIEERERIGDARRVGFRPGLFYQKYDDATSRSLDPFDFVSGRTNRLRIVG